VGAVKSTWISSTTLALMAVAIPACTRAATPAAGTSGAGGQAVGGPQAEISYAGLCAPCHGKDGQGYAADHAPSLVNPTFLESATDDFLRRSIVTGRPGTSMGAYGKAMGGPLDDRGIERIVSFLRAGRSSARALPTPGPGDARRGAPIYAQLCQPCHGDAKTRGEAVHLANTEFLKQASDAFIRHAIVYGRPGTKMMPFANSLSASIIDDVVAFVRGLANTQPQVDLLPEPTGTEPLVLNPKGKDPGFKTREGRFVGVEQVNAALAARRRMIIIDARPPSEWRRVHITGAVSIPYHDLKRLAEVPDDVWAIAYCACPHHLSGDVVNALIQRGHKQALVLDEGINEWHRRGYPVIAAKGVRPPANEGAPVPLPPKP